MCYSRGQALSLQCVVSVFDPAQLLPPFDGSGSVHALLLNFVPSPHVTVHVMYSPHVVHAPSTLLNCIDIRLFSSYITINHSINGKLLIWNEIIKPWATFAFYDDFVIFKIHINYWFIVVKAKPFFFV